MQFLFVQLDLMFLLSIENIWSQDFNKIYNGISECSACSTFLKAWQTSLLGNRSCDGYVNYSRSNYDKVTYLLLFRKNTFKLESKNKWCIGRTTTWIYKAKQDSCHSVPNLKPIISTTRFDNKIDINRKHFRWLLNKGSIGLSSSASNVDVFRRPPVSAMHILSDPFKSSRKESILGDCVRSGCSNMSK